MNVKVGTPAVGRGTFTPHLTDAVGRDWRQLAAEPGATERFDPASLASLPEPARRWLSHAIAPGTPLRYRVELDQHGEIRLGAWRTFRARQALAAGEGYIWAVTTRVFGLPVHGYDRFSHGTGEMCHRLLGRIPVVSSAGPDHTRSAAARLASEGVWTPAAALGPDVVWEAVDDHRVRMLVPIGGRTHVITLTVAPSGALRWISLPRWAKVGKEPYREHLFTAECHAEGTYDGYTVPTRVTAGYEDPTSRWPRSAFIRQTIDHATYH